MSEESDFELAKLQKRMDIALKSFKLALEKNAPNWDCNVDDVLHNIIVFKNKENSTQLFYIADEDNWTPQEIIERINNNQF